MYPPAAMRTRHFANTHTGLRRDRNEDAYLADARIGLFLVLEGVGGEVASAGASELIWEWIKREEPPLREAIAEAQRLAPSAANSGDMLGRFGALLRGAVQDALAEVDPERRGISTTASIAQVVGQQIVVGQVGDSRVYLARDGQVTRLTRPAPPEQAAVGLRDLVAVDILVVGVQPGDRLLLCSDGLHACLHSDAILTELFRLDVRAAAPAAIQHANACGGADNITALFVEFIAD
jgi:serine/threonine protein phosphatase PrpC